MSKYLTLKYRIVAAIYFMLVVTVALIFLNVFTLNERRSTPVAWTYLSLGNALATMVEASVRETVSPISEIRQNARRELPTLISAMEGRFRTLIDGSEENEVTAIRDAEIRRDLLESQRRWETDVRPLIDQIRDAPDSTEVPALLEEFRVHLDGMKERITTNVERMQEIMTSEINRSVRMQYIFLAIVVLFLLIFGVVIGKVFTAVEGVIRDLNISSAELSSGTAQQSASAQEQAAAINEVVATVDQVQQTSAQSAQRAKDVASSAKAALEIGQAGLVSVEESMFRINQVQGHTETIGSEILVLAESAQAIGEIIAVVNEITEQTNILALNAGIEAAKAGEQGAGFSVVAREIKDLAKQSKQETIRVRKILTEIQKATNNVVMVTEEGSKAVGETVSSVTSAGDTIRALVKTIKDASTSANQISASTQQQSTGMNQIQQAIREINEAVTQTTTTSRQIERIAFAQKTRRGDLKKLLRIG